MAQIQSPETYADGQQVTAARLNNQTNGAVLLPGAVTDQTAISGGVASGDAVIVHDASTSALRKATVGEVLGGGVPVVASSVTGVAGADLVITPAAGQKADVAGPFEAESINSVGNTTVGGNASVTGTLLVTGSSTLTGNVTADNAFTSNGIANFTGQLQVNGAVGYVLTEVTEYTPSPWVATAGLHEAIYTSPSFTKPSDEIWVFETFFRHSGKKGYNYDFAARYGSQTFRTGSYIFVELMTDGSGGGSHTEDFHTARWVVPAGTAIASDTLKVDAFAASGSELRMFSTTGLISNIVTTGTVSASKFRIYKYKTA